MMTDVSRHRRLFDDLAQKRIEFIDLTHRLKLDASIIEVFHKAADIKPTSEIFHGVSKSHALNPAFKNYLSRNHQIELT